MSPMAATSLPRSQHGASTLSHGHPGLRSTRPPLRPAHGPELRIEEIRFRQLTTPEEIASILHLRSEINLPSAGQAGFAALEKKRDEMGFVGAFEWRGHFIGTIRLVPLGFGLAPCEQYLNGAPLPPEILADGWEVGRLVLSPQYRSHPEVLKSCFFLTLMRFIESTPKANFFASCNALLSRLYRRFGFSMLLKDACQNAGESYSLIHGTVPSVQQAVAGTQAMAVM